MQQNHDAEGWKSAHFPQNADVADFLRNAALLSFHMFERADMYRLAWRASYSSRGSQRHSALRCWSAPGAAPKSSPSISGETRLHSCGPVADRFLATYASAQWLAGRKFFSGVARSERSLRARLLFRD
jgi:hypothetical protein